ncbi:MAG: DUF433 domain-containing protein [Saprospiraceae bacterium]|jgi:uncharacterized protein (DUF433 family)|nr:DUF433 domain-containing protein [Lewinellaceae bacterium]
MEDTLLNRITIDPNICHGKPVVRGLRYPVEDILDLLASNMTHQQILEDYEDLEEEDLQACLLFAKKMIQVKHIGKLVA